MELRALRWADLTLREGLSVIGYIAALPLISLALRVWDYKRTFAWIQRISPPSPGAAAATTALSGASMAPLHRLALLVQRAGSVWSMANTSCLRQSLLLFYLLRRRGLDPKIQFGVASGKGAFDMHAWTELAGVRVGQLHERFQAFR